MPHGTARVHSLVQAGCDRSHCGCDCAGPGVGIESLQYVTTSLLVGSNQSEAALYGLDVDADGTPDKELGRTLAALPTVIP